MLSHRPPWPDVSRNGAWTALVHRWVDDEYGPVQALGGARMSHPEPGFWVFTADFTRTPVGNWFGGQPTGAAGTSIDADEALLRCLGEITERYSALTAPIDGSLRRIDPELHQLFARCAVDENCSPTLRGQPPTARVTHVPMMRLADGASVQIPAGHVHLNFLAADEPVLAMPISSGLAFDPSLQTALWRGICEVAERDALMLTWWQRRRAAEINLGREHSHPPAGVGRELSNRLTTLAAVELRARFFDITTDFAVPTVMCVLTGERFPYLTVGAACRDDVAAACAKALDEAVSARVAVHGSEGFAPPSLTDFSWIADLEQHARLYAAGHLRQAFDFLLDGEQPAISLAEIRDRQTLLTPQTMADLRGIARDLEEKIGLTVLWTDVTAPEINDEGHVIKIVIPQMVPLSQLHSVRWLGTPRLYRSGDGAEPRASSFSPYPHPFA
jgi:ribosomal protein S12 methylthiotransferase accessory factor